MRQQTRGDGLGEEGDEKKEILDRWLESVEQEAHHDHPDESPERLEGEDGGHVADLDSNEVLEVQQGRTPD